MGDATTRHLRELADADLYRRNAFRITGLATDAGVREVRERQKKNAAAAVIGVASASDPRLPLPQPPTNAEVRAAYEVLADPRRRLVHELFWLWGEDVDGCDCLPEDHLRHDRAVMAHAAALDRELAGDEAAWSAARDAWQTTEAFDDTDHHLWARVQALDDPRVDATDVTDLRHGTARALVATVVACAAASDAPQRLREEAERWPIDTGDLDDLLLDAVGERVDAIEARLTEARRLLEGDPLGATRLLRPATVDDLARVDALAPHQRVRRLADLREDTAILLNNAAQRLVERGRDHALALEVFAEAVALATTHRTRDTILRNEVEVRASRPDVSRPAPRPARVGSVPATAPGPPASRRVRLLRNGPSVILGLALAGAVVALFLGVVVGSDDAQGVLAMGVVIGTLLGIALVAALAVGTVIASAAGVSAAIAAGVRRCVGWWSRRRPGPDPARTTTRQRAVGWTAAAVVPLLAGAVVLGVATGSLVLAVIVLVAALLVGTTVALVVTS